MDTPSTKIKIAILGAGIGGLALAIGLIRRGIPVKIYEAAGSFSALGAGIGFGPNALNALELIDPQLRERYNTAATQNEKSEFKNSVYDVLYAEPGFGEKRGWTRGLVGAPYFTRSSAHRKDLLDILTSFIPSGTVVFGKRATLIEQAGNEVIVTFEDGRELACNAVIGCDGVKGITREVVLRDIAQEKIPPTYCGTYVYRGIIPMENAKEILGKHSGDAKWFMAEGKGVVVYPISKGKELNFVFFVKDTDTWAQGDAAVPCTQEEMEADLSGLDGRLLKLLAWATPLRWPMWHHPDTPTYYKGHVCLLGDVAHASSPSQAAGAGQALEDAVILAQLLALPEDPTQIEAAFRIYDSIRRPRAQKVVNTSYAFGRIRQWLDPDFEDDMQKIVDHANSNLHWIWQHDVSADLEQAESEFREAVGSRHG